MGQGTMLRLKTHYNNANDAWPGDHVEAKDHVGEVHGDQGVLELRPLSD